MSRGFPLSSPHTHTPYCDGKSTAAEMVASALAHGKIKGITVPPLEQTNLDRLISEVLPGRDTAGTRSLVVQRLPDRLRKNGGGQPLEALGLLLETPQFQRR